MENKEFKAIQHFNDSSEVFKNLEGVAILEKNRILRDFSNEGRKHKKVNPLGLTFYVFCLHLEKIQKAVFSSIAIPSLGQKKTAPN